MGRGGRTVLKLLTNSRVKSFRRCQRHHYYSYVLGAKPVETAAPLEFGTTGHLGLEWFWNGIRMGMSGPAILQAMGQAIAPFARKPFEFAKLTAMLSGYCMLWTEITPFRIKRVLGVEQTFQVPLVHPRSGETSSWMLAGKLDVLFELQDGRIAIGEHKSSSEDVDIGGAYHGKLTMDGQVSQYFEGASAILQTLGIDRRPDVILYDVLSKPMLRPYEKTEKIRIKKNGEPYANQRLADETPVEFAKRCLTDIHANMSDYYHVYEVVRFGREIQDYKLDIWQYGEQIDRQVETGQAPRNPDACFMGKRACEYLGVCTGTRDINDPQAYRIDAHHVHPELGV